MRFQLIDKNVRQVQENCCEGGCYSQRIITTRGLFKCHVTKLPSLSWSFREGGRVMSKEEELNYRDQLHGNILDRFYSIKWSNKSNSKCHICLLKRELQEHSVRPSMLSRFCTRWNSTKPCRYTLVDRSQILVHREQFKVIIYFAKFLSDRKAVIC